MIRDVMYRYQMNPSLGIFFFAILFQNEEEMLKI